MVNLRIFVLLLLLVSSQSLSDCPSLPSNFIPVPIVRQANNYSCGAAALLSVLYYWQVYDEGEATLYKPLKTTEKEGTHPKRIVSVARSFGLDAKFVIDQKIEDLRLALNNGVTVILDLQAWPDEDDEGKAWKDIWEAGHYVVLVGLDDHFIYTMDPSIPSSYGFIPISELYDRWHDYENERGKRWENFGLAIYIKGKEPLKSMPGPLVKIE